MKTRNNEWSDAAKFCYWLKNAIRVNGLKWTKMKKSKTRDLCESNWQNVLCKIKNRRTAMIDKKWKSMKKRRNDRWKKKRWKKKKTTKDEESSYIQKKDRLRWRLARKSHAKFIQGEGCLEAENWLFFAVLSFIKKKWMSEWLHKRKKGEVF